MFYVLNTVRLPRLARYLQAVLIVSNSLEDLINLMINFFFLKNCEKKSVWPNGTEKIDIRLALYAASMP